VRIGVLGGGQLGRMLGQAGRPLGFSFTFLEPAEECPAAATGDWIRAGFDQPQALEALAQRSGLVTYEFENVPVEALRTIEPLCPVRPSARSLETAQDRVREKEFLARLGIATPRWEAVDDPAALAAAVARVGFPAVLKTRRMGYDGRGQRLLRTRDDLAPAWAALGGAALLVEAFVPFERELSILGVRGTSGECAFYPLVENHHPGGILRLSLAPAPGLGPGLQARAEALARAALEALGHEGVMAIELFQSGEALIANEIAPRVHNSGHWTIEGAATSQFENHLRAIAGRPLGPTTARGHAAMVNLIGVIPDDLDALAARSPDVHVHRYDKRPRPGRKLGHVTICAERPEALAPGLAAVWRMLGDEAGPMPAAAGERPAPTKARA